MSAASFRQAWHRHYPNFEPVGYELLHAGARPWIRFHSLPESKRYADTETEWRELLARQNELASAVLGEDQKCWLVQSAWELTPGVTDYAFRNGNDPFRAITDHGLESAIITVRDQGTEDERRWEACAGLTTWASGRFDQLLRQIANDQAAPTLWLSHDTGSVFAPYDGGVDLFLPDERMVTALAERYPGWLSAHPSGL